MKDRGIYYPDDFKRKYGLTNSEIAKGIDSLSDDDFLEVFKELWVLHGGNLDDLECTQKFCDWLNTVLNEIEFKEE
jgi:hypothetical protein